jgi:hypothetical protein
LCKKYFGKEAAIIGYMHLFGDQSENKPDNDLKFNPHVNVHIIEEKSVHLKLSQETIEKIKVSWKKDLIGLGMTGLKVVDVQYLFKIATKKKYHTIKYMT